jgi:hypothetical protein
VCGKVRVECLREDVSLSQNNFPVGNFVDWWTVRALCVFITAGPIINLFAWGEGDGNSYGVS